eukprot:6523149-Pyramimonas_sp.AAC.1
MKEEEDQQQQQQQQQEQERTTANIHVTRNAPLCESEENHAIWEHHTSRPTTGKFAQRTPGGAHRFADHRE